MEELTRAQEMRIDEFSRHELGEIHSAMLELTQQIQELKERMNSVNDSVEFQEVESNYSGKISHVPRQPEVIPSSSSLLSRHKRLPFDTWCIELWKVRHEESG